MLKPQGARAWIAPLGTPLDGSGWVEIGTIADDGIVYQEESVPYSFTRAFFASQPPKVERAARERRRLEISSYRWPDASRVKREYHRRRR